VGALRLKYKFIFSKVRLKWKTSAFKMEKQARLKWKKQARLKWKNKCV
jgi:hypothetical protein